MPALRLPAADATFSRGYLYNRPYETKRNEFLFPADDELLAAPEIPPVPELGKPYILCDASQHHSKKFRGGVSFVALGSFLFFNLIFIILIFLVNMLQCTSLMHGREWTAKLLIPPNLTSIEPRF